MGRSGFASARMQMVAEQAMRTPKGQWVRVVGGWSPYQFREKRMPTVAELNAAAPQTPVYVLFAYSEGLLNKAGVAALGWTADTKPPEGGSYEFVDGGAMLRKPAAAYTPIGMLPPLSAEDQVNSTQHFFRELSRFGLTSALDAGATNTPYPDAYQALAKLAARPAFPIRVSNLLFAQRPGTEREFYEKLTVEEKQNVNRAASRLNGYVFEAQEKFWSGRQRISRFHGRASRPAATDGTGACRGDTAGRAETVADPAARTYDESISRILDVFERFSGTGYNAR